jgi:Protein of unknown function (DUF3572)
MHKSPLMPASQFPDMPQDMAEAIALEGLAFLAEDRARLQRFLDLTGLQPLLLRRDAAEPFLQRAVLEHLAADESLLLAFAANRALAPESIARALALLEAKQR